MHPLREGDWVKQFAEELAKQVPLTGSAQPVISPGPRRNTGRAMAGEDTDFWLALCTIGPVMFLALGALLVELDRERGPRWKRPWQKVQLAAMNVSFLGTLLATVTAILSLAWRSNLLPPKVLGVTVVAILAFWISLLAHFQDVEKTSGKDS